MVFSCCVLTCRQKGGVKMHTFPYSIPELYNEWLKRIHRVDFFDMEPKRVATNYRICEKHFSDFAKIGGQCRSRTGLKKFALPNLHLPGFKEIPTKENSILPKNLIMEKIPGRVTDKIIRSESSLSLKTTQVLQEKILKCDEQTSSKTIGLIYEIEPSRVALSVSKLIDQEDIGTNENLNLSNTLTTNNSEIFDENNGSLEISGHNLPDFHKFAYKENSLSSYTEIMDELFATYPKSGIDLNKFFESSLTSLFSPACAC